MEILVLIAITTPTHLEIRTFYQTPLLQVTIRTLTNSHKIQHKIIYTIQVIQTAAIIAEIITTIIPPAAQIKVWEIHPTITSRTTTRINRAITLTLTPTTTTTTVEVKVHLLLSMSKRIHKTTIIIPTAISKLTTAKII